MLVDDEPNILETSRRVLERAGYRVFTLESPLDALDLLSRESFDLVVLDIMMPGMSGLEIVERVQAMARVPIIVVMSGYGTPDVMNEAQERGVQGFLPKPFTPGELRTAVARALAG